MESLVKLSDVTSQQIKKNELYTLGNSLIRRKLHRLLSGGVGARTLAFSDLSVLVSCRFHTELTSLRVQKDNIPGWERVESAAKSGLGFGAVVGAVRGNWDFHYVKNESSLGALSKSATILGSTMLLFGGVAVTYAACEAAMESFRGEADWKNGAVAGLAAGSIMGLRTGSFGVAATSGMMFAAASVTVDAFGGQERHNIFSQDGKPTSDPFADRIVMRKY